MQEEIYLAKYILVCGMQIFSETSLMIPLKGWFIFMLTLVQTVGAMERGEHSCYILYKVY